MNQTIFNAEALVAVEISDKRKVIDLLWLPEIKSRLGRIKRHAGFYEMLWVGRYEGFSKEQLETGGYWGTKLIVIGEEAFYRPFVNLVFAAGRSINFVFDTIEEAIEYGEAQARKGIKVRVDKPNIQQGKTLVQMIKERMSLMPDDPTLTDRGAYDAYTNVLNWIEKGNA